MGGTINYDQSTIQAISLRDARLKASMAEISIIVGNITSERKQMVATATVEKIVTLLNAQLLTSYQLTAILCERAGKIGMELRLITEDNFIEALQIAKKCDMHREESKKKNWVFGDEWDMQKYLPPLFGVTISVKDNIDIKGMLSTLGLRARANNRMNKDSMLVTCFRNAGMIPFVKTNMPQIGMTTESMNNLFGRSENPYNRERSPGGSSGGEGGLIASQCSVLGVGNDVGGSVRIPCAFCGLFGIKSSFNRFSNDFTTKYATSFSGLQTIKISTGPLSASVQALALWYKTVSCNEFYQGTYDPFHKLMAFDDKQYMKEPKKCRIGYLTHMKLIQTSPAFVRAMSECKKLLQQQGHQLIPVQIPHEQELIQAFFRNFTSAGRMRGYIDMLQGQPFCEEYNKMKLINNMNRPLHSFITWLLSKLRPRLSIIAGANGQCSTYQHLINTGNILEYRRQFVKYWKQNNLDYLIMPTASAYAFKHGMSNELVPTCAYTFIWNILDMTAGTVPYTLVQPGQTQFLSRYEDQITDYMRVNNKGAEGTPVSLQIVALPFEDQKVLGLMRQIQNRNQFNVRYKKRYEAV